MSTIISKDGRQIHQVPDIGAEAESGGRVTLETAQRRLTTHQKAVLVQVLRTFPDERVRICYSPSTTDGRSYAEDFVCVFRAIGWRVDGPEAAGGPSTESGLALVSSEMSPPPCAEALRDALRIYGIEIQVDCSALGRVTAESFLLSVGRNVERRAGGAT